MELKFTRHAKNRNRKIQATVFEIIECIESPDSYYIQADGKEIAIKAMGNKLLKVVFRRNPSGYDIITIIDRNR